MKWMNLPSLLLVCSLMSPVMAQTARIPVKVLKGHVDHVFGLAFTPDGKTLASGSHDNTIRLWDVESGEYFGSIYCTADRVRGLAFSPDGKLLAACHCDKIVTLWNMDSLQQIATLEGHRSEVYTVAFTPDGKTVAAGGFDGTVRLWNVADGKPVKTLSGHGSFVWTIAFSKDGKQLVSTGGMDRTARLWNVETGRTERLFTGHTGKSRFVGFLPSQKRVVTASDDQSVRFWDITNGKELRKVVLPGGQFCGSVSPDGSAIAIAGSARQIRLLNGKTGGVEATLSGHTQTVWSLQFSPNGKLLASGGEDKTVRLWTVAGVIPKPTDDPKKDDPAEKPAEDEKPGDPPEEPAKD